MRSRHNSRAHFCAAIALLLVCGTASAQTPLGSAVTYQGQLKNAGSPANGNFSMVFKLWDDSAVGNQVGPTLTFDGAGGNPAPVAVASGLFTVSLDFDAASYNGDKRWLEITVSGTTLSPRQELTAAPFSRFSSAPWETNGSNVSYSGGNVGVGTAVPVSRLSIQAGYQDDVNVFGIPATAGAEEAFSLRADYGSGVFHSTLRLRSEPNALDAMTWTADGNVGIGTTSPANRLSVAGNADITGNVGIGTTSPTQKLTVAGTVESTSGGFKFPNGSVQSSAAGQWTASGNNIYNSNSGNVGIGTTNPANRLQVGDFLSFAHESLAIESALDCGIKFRTQDDTHGFDITDSSSTGLRFTRVGASAPSISINPLTGNVGIGISTSALNTLQVGGTAGFSGNVGIGTGFPIANLHVRGQMFMDGSLGINALPADPYKLFVSGDAAFFGTAQMTGFRLTTGASPGTVLTSDGSGNGTWQAGAAEQWTLNGTDISNLNSGNVGIGTTAPGQRLHVVGNICATGTIGACSDARFKKNVMGLTDALDQVTKLRGVSFEWKRDEFCDHQFAEGSQLGFIAQEVEKVLPQIVQTGSDGYRSVDYGRLTPMLVEAIKEMRAEKDEQLAKRDAELTALKERIAVLERLIGEVRQNARSPQ